MVKKFLDIDLSQYASKDEGIEIELHKKILEQIKVFKAAGNRTYFQDFVKARLPELNFTFLWEDDDGLSKHLAKSLLNYNTSTVTTAVIE